MSSLDVAVIIPVKNRADLLYVTLQNILGQSLTPAEVCVVDDHSTDHIKEVIAQFGSRVTFITNRAHGPAAARNTGYLATTAPLVQFFDSDDLLTHHKLEAFAKAISHTGADMAYGPYVKAQEVKPGIWEQKDVIMQYGPLPTDDLEFWILRGWNALTQSMLFRRSFLETVPLWDEAHMPTEDYLYMARLAAQKPKLVFVPQETVIYRQHGQQITGDQIKEKGKALDMYLVMQKIYQEVDWTRQSFLSKILFQGRLYLGEQFTHQMGVLPNVPKHSAFMSYAFFYRLYNKFERLLTRSAWERMHAVSANPQHFSEVLAKLN